MGENYEVYIDELMMFVYDTLKLPEKSVKIP